MKVKSLVMALFLSCIAFAASAATLTLRSLDQAELTKLLKGNTLTVGPSAILKGKYVDDTISVYFASDGTLIGQWKNPIPGTTSTDTGTWTTQADKLCVQWQQWGTSCVGFYPMEKNYLVVDDTQDALIVPKTNIVTGNTLSSTPMTTTNQ